MKLKLLISINIFLLIIFPMSSISDVNNTVDKPLMPVTKLSYIEREPGVDDYGVTVIVSDRYIRIDETEEDSGFIIYDDKENAIYSVSHGDKSVLFIKAHDFSNKQSPVKSSVEYLPLIDAPKVADKSMFNYRVFVNKEGDDSNKSDEINCMEVQLAEGFLPEVRELLQNYQKVISGQQVQMVDNNITEMQTACFYVDQVYNEGRYYEKGLPIQEWHSNGKFKALTSYKQTEVDASFFSIPEDYKQFSMDINSKRFLQ